jgi:hypothetical protein
MKARTRRIMRLWSGRLTTEPPDPRQVGVNASTHCRPCGCWMCQEKSKQVPPLRERRFTDFDLAETGLGSQGL